MSYLYCDFRDHSPRLFQSLHVTSNAFLAYPNKPALKLKYFRIVFVVIFYLDSVDSGLNYGIVGVITEPVFVNV